MDELILVGLEDEETGSMEKAEVHRLGRLHRAFSVFLVRDGRMLLQKRKMDKYHSGGLWTNACCSHPRKGEELDGAVHRRMEEELGIDCELEELFSFVYYTRFAEDLYEYELDHVFLGEGKEELRFNPEEIEEVRWVALEDLKRELEESPQRFSSWFLIACPRVLRILKER